jgi:hypothetical protein
LGSLVNSVFTFLVYLEMPYLESERISSPKIDLSYSKSGLSIVEKSRKLIRDEYVVLAYLLR